MKSSPESYYILVLLLAAVSSLIQSAASKTISDTQQAAHQRLSRAVHQQWSSKGKRWTRYGNKVWSEPIRIGFHNYTDRYSREDQDAILKECTDMWTLPGRLEFIIINPTPQNKAHITISYKNIDDLQLLNGQYQTLGYSYAPQPQSPEGTKIVLGYYDKALRLRKYDAYGSSFKLIVCHEIGHAIGVNDSYDKRTIMHYNAGFTEAADDVLDWDSRNAVRWLYYIPYPTTTTSQTTSTASKTNSTTTSSIKPPTTTTSSPTTRDGVEFETTTMATYSSASYVSPTKAVLVIYSMIVICLNNFISEGY